MSAARPRQRLKLAPRQEGFSALIGPFYEAQQDGVQRRLLWLDARHANPEGVIHGGVLSAFLDFVLYRCIGEELGHERPYATVQLNVQFLAAARPERWLYGEGLVLRRTRRLIFAAGELYTEDGPIVQGSGIWKLIEG